MKRELDALVGRYEWFTPARILRVLRTGRSDRRVSIAAVSRLLPLGRFTVDREALCALSPADLIDRFLKEGGHRIVAEEGEVVEEVRTEAELSGDDDLVTEDLAEIYLAQGALRRSNRHLSQIKFVKSGKKCLLCVAY